jgi:hypothetical protein
LRPLQHTREGQTDSDIINGTTDASGARMLLPFSPEPEQPETPPVPEVAPFESHDAIEEAEADMEGEENEWPATA